MKKIAALILTFVFFSFFTPSNVFALSYCDFSPTGATGQPYGDVTLSASCVIYEQVNGVSLGDLTLNGTTITLNSTLVFAPNKKINFGSNSFVYINTNGKILQRVLCIKDADGDHYADVTLLTTDPATGDPITAEIYQIDKKEADINGQCPAGYVTSDGINIYNLTAVDSDPLIANTDGTTADSELLRLGFTVAGISDAIAAAGDVQVLGHNLLVCTNSTCPATTLSASGDLYVQGKVGIGITNPTYPLDVTGNTRLTGTLDVTSTTTLPAATSIGTVSSTEIGYLDNVTSAIQTQLTTATNHISATGASHSYIDQNVTTTGTPTFATVNTGQGAYELYSMNQNVTTTSSPTFAGITISTTNGSNICSLVSYTDGSGTVSCPTDYYTYSGVGLTTGQLLCCKVSNPI